MTNYTEETLEDYKNAKETYEQFKKYMAILGKPLRKIYPDQQKK